MNIKKFLLALTAVMTMCIVASAYRISGSVYDGAGEPLPQATVRVLQPDSTYIKGGATDLNGKFSLDGFDNGRYIVETSYVGLEKTHTNTTVNDADVNLGKIVMGESSIVLQETVVKGIRSPIKVMEDTIEFDAAAYKTAPNSVVEDLLKRLPGVEVSSDGTITANGKTVSKFLVEGKEFFSDDPKVASKNLPVDIIDKLQVVDRKSDFTRLTGVDDGEEETVINLTVKKDMQNGWFGNAEAGYGTDDRYKGSFMINRFSNGNQFTILGNANNVNDMGFTDGNGGRFRQFGGNNGITTSQSLGLNFNAGNKEIFRVGGNVLYFHSDRHTAKRSNREYLLENDPYTQNSTSDTSDKSHNLRADFRIEWRPDSFNVLDVRPQFSYNHNRSVSDALAVASGKNLTLNRGNSDGDSYEFQTRFIYTHKFRSHRGRSISLNANYRYSNVLEDEDTYSYNLFYNYNDSTYTSDQYLDNHTWSNRVNARLTWTEPLGDVANGNFLTIGYGINYTWNNADKLVYDRPVAFDGTTTYMLNGVSYAIPNPVADNGAMVLSDTLSNRFRNTLFEQEIRLGYQKVTSKANFNIGISLQPVTSQSTNLINDAKSIPSRSAWNIAPFMRFRYKFAKRSSIQANYNGRTSQPSMTYLQPVADYSDPMNIRVGNPELLPTFTHNFQLRQQHFDQDAQRAIMSMLMVSYAQNSIVQKTTYNTLTGGRVTTYDNVNGIWNVRLMNMYSQPLRNKSFTINNHFMVGYNRNVGWNNADFNVSNNFNLNESFGIAFRPENLELELRPNYRLSMARNSAASLKSSTTHSYGGSFYGTYYTPFGIVLATDLAYTANRGFAAGYNEDTWMWNASISYQFLSGKAATIQLKAYDLLQQKKNINRTVTAAYIDNTRYNDLTRYFMISFTYRFNTFGKGNEPKSSQRGFGGPEGPRGGVHPGGGPGGGRPPMM